MTDGMTEAARNEVKRQVEEIERLRLALGHLQLAINTLAHDGSRQAGELLIRQILLSSAGLLRELAAEIASRSESSS